MFRHILVPTDGLKLSEKAVEYHVTQSLKFMRLHLKDFIIVELFLLNL